MDGGICLFIFASALRQDMANVNMLRRDLIWECERADISLSLVIFMTLSNLASFLINIPRYRILWLLLAVNLDWSLADEYSYQLRS